jgi:ATP-binding cassette subfamily C protein
MAAAVGLGLVMVVLLRWTRGLAERSGRGAHDLGKEILRTLQHALGAIKEIKALGREGFFYRTFADKQRELLSLGYLGVTLQTIPPVLVETVFVCGALILIGVLALGGHVGADALPLLGLLGYAGLRLMPMANRLTWQVNQVRAARAAVNDLYDDYRLVTGGGWGNDGHAATTLTLHDRITVDRVSYTYPNAPAPALRDVTLTVARGEAVGFVGPTGAGKSTLVDVMIGLLSPTDGRVTVDGTDLAAGDPRRWHRHVGYVPQSIYLIDASVRENVALGIAPAEIDERRVREAIRIAQLDEVIARLPDGLDAVLGERGVLLSGGERQRVGIARALYHDPDLLVLDEATAALDLATERAVTQAIRALHGHKTVLVIAHRLSTVRSCDRIGLIVGGRLREWGTYDELLSRSDEFRALAVPTETEPSTSAASSSPMRRS